MQKLRNYSEISWDDDIPDSLHTFWNNFRQQLRNLEYLNISRKITAILHEDIKSNELHCFCDASDKGYGACIYIRVRDKRDNFYVNLLCSKTKVAPLKKQTTPRLELCGALLLAKLYEKVKKCIKIMFNQTIFWTDSTITLHRIRLSSLNFATFVGNRISLIQDITNIDHWHYIPSDLNPADICSRGLMKSDIIECSLWWFGPKFFRTDETLWNFNEHCFSENDLDEKPAKNICTSCNDTSHDYDITLRVLDYSRAIRFTASWLRVLQRLRRQTTTIFKGPLQIHELDYALKTITRRIQHQAFSKDFKHLQLYKWVHKSSRLKTLSPFIDDDGILRVGGRLENAKLSYDQKHPMLLPGDHNFSKLICRHEHIV